jgi:4a-hydroxytetrahydrobiopterin dehydratase
LAIVGALALESVMTRPHPIDVEDALAALPGWSRVEGRQAIRRLFLFRDFGSAFAFMTRCALAAERADHHPEWSNVFNRVEVVLATHDVGGVTSLDVELARTMDAAYAAFTSP